MSAMSNIREGMEVYGTDGQVIGTVEKIHGNGIHVNGQHIDGGAIARVAQNKVYLRTGYQVDTTTEQMRTGTATAATAEEGTIRVPVAEERLSVDKQAVELGEVELRKTVTQEQVSVPVDVMREEVHVERRDIDDRPLAAADAERLFEEGTIRVPVRGEEVVVTKEAVVTGEVVINKEQTTEHQEITDTVRKQRVEVDENYQQARATLEQRFAQRQSKAGSGATRTFEEAEPNYRAGYAAAHDERFAGREFEQVEPELRRTHGSGSGGWEQLREEIREGWETARGQ